MQEETKMPCVPGPPPHQECERYLLQTPLIRKWLHIQHIPVCLCWFTLLITASFSFTYVVTIDRVSFCFKAAQYSLWIEILAFLYSSISSWTLWLIPYLETANDAAVNVGVQVSLPQADSISCGCRPGRGCCQVWALAGRDYLSGTTLCTVPGIQWAFGKYF